MQNWRRSTRHFVVNSFGDSFGSGSSFGADGMVVAASHNALLLVGDSTPDEVLKALRTLGIVIRACTTSFFLARVILGIAAFSA